ncbi:DUF6228 family protein [Micromonospora sp. LZ34]
MSEAFVLQPFGRWVVVRVSSGQRWIVRLTQDPYGDGYVYTIATELHADGLTASTVAKIDGQFFDLDTTLSGFVQRLAADWQGWNGVRTWTSWERELAIDARHDGRGYVSVPLGRERGDDHVDAGVELADHVVEVVDVGQVQPA